MLKNLIGAFLAVMLFSFSAQGQSEWTNYYKDKLAVIDYHYADCHQPEKGIEKQEVYLRFKNLTQQTITITYQKQAEYNGKAAGVPDEGNMFTVNLKPGEVIEGHCGMRDKRLYLFVKMLDGSSGTQLTSFKLLNIKVSRS
jgi:hypothetical protein